MPDRLVIEDFLSIDCIFSNRVFDSAITAIKDIEDDFSISKSKSKSDEIQVGKIFVRLFGLLLIVNALMRLLHFFYQMVQMPFLQSCYLFLETLD